MQANTIVIDPKDNVGVSLQELPLGTPLRIKDALTQDAPLVTAELIPQFHKVALTAIPEGEPVIKYGEYIGFATSDIAPGQWVHTHNTKSTDAKKEVVDEVADLESSHKGGR